MTWGCGLLLVLADVNRVMKYEMVKVDLLGSCFTSVFSARRMGIGLEKEHKQQSKGNENQDRLREIQLLERSSGLFA